MTKERWGTTLYKMEKADEEDEKRGLSQGGGRLVATGSYCTRTAVVEVKQPGFKTIYR